MMSNNNYNFHTCLKSNIIIKAHHLWYDTQVLNEEYVLHPSPLSDSEDDPGSDNVCKRNAYEEHIYQCEDERYEVSNMIRLFTIW